MKKGKKRRKKREGGENKKKRKKENENKSNLVNMGETVVLGMNHIPRFSGLMVAVPQFIGKHISGLGGKGN
jgi:hypothetical protein